MNTTQLHQATKSLDDVLAAAQSLKELLDFHARQKTSKREVFDETTAGKFDKSLGVLVDAFFEVWSEGYDAGHAKGHLEGQAYLHGICTYMDEVGERRYICDPSADPTVLNTAKRMTFPEACELKSMLPQLCWLPVAAANKIFGDSK